MHVYGPFVGPHKAKVQKGYGESCGLAVEHSAHDQKVVGSMPVRPMVDVSGVKAMPGSIPTPHSGSL